MSLQLAGEIYSGRFSSQYNYRQLVRRCHRKAIGLGQERYEFRSIHTICGIRVRTKFPFLYSVFNKFRRDIYLVILRLYLRADDPKEVFSFYFKRNLFGDPDSKSGTGSSRPAIESIGSALPPLLVNLNIQVILDIPCGVFNWAKEIDWNPFHYIGADIVSGLAGAHHSVVCGIIVVEIDAAGGQCRAKSATTSAMVSSSLGQGINTATSGGQALVFWFRSLWYQVLNSIR